MTIPEVVNFTTQEQLLSADLNLMGALSGQALMDSLLALMGTIDTTATIPDMVRRGLLATPGSGFTLNISAGNLIRFGAASGTQSAARLATLAADTNLDLTATQYDPQTNTTTGAGTNPPDSGSPRIYRVSVADGLYPEGAQTRNVINLPSRTVTPESIDTSQNPGIVFTITAGSPSGNPVPPSTPSGTTALWDIYVPAAATTVASNHLMDLRRPFVPGPVATGHKVIDGLGMVSTDGANIQIRGGNAVVNGVPVNAESNLTISAANLNFNGAALTASTEYTVYMIACGTGDPLAGITGTSSGYMFVAVPASSGVGAPNSSGRPGSPLSYYPLLSAGLTNVTLTTPNALYVGSIRTDPTGAYELGGWGASLGPDGSTAIDIINPVTGGLACDANGYLQRPRLVFIASNTIIQVSTGYVILNGEPMNVGAQASFGSNLVSGESRPNPGFCYVYARRQTPKSSSRLGMRSTVIRLSSEAPGPASIWLGKPTPESGFASSDYIYLGSFYCTSSIIVPFTQAGNRFTFSGTYSFTSQLGLVNTTIPYSTTAVPMLIPQSGAYREGLVGRVKLAVSYVIASSGSVTATLSDVANSWDYENAGLSDVGPGRFDGEYDVASNTAGTVNLAVSTTGTVSGAVTLYQTGYTDL